LCRSLHHDDQATLEALVAMVGARLHYLPPYSPELNPIEMAFGSVLGYLRAHSNDPRFLAVDGYYDLLDEAFRSIDYRKASSFVGHMYTELGKVHCRGPAL
jgi:transposase